MPFSPQQRVLYVSVVSSSVRRRVPAAERTLCSRLPTRPAKCQAGTQMQRPGPAGASRSDGHMPFLTFVLYLTVWPRPRSLCQILGWDTVTVTTTALFLLSLWLVEIPVLFCFYPREALLRPNRDGKSQNSSHGLM